MDAQEVTLIVGAGISVPAPTEAPDFRKLRNHFLSRIDGLGKQIDFELDELSPEQVFDGLDDGREETRRAIRREIWWECEPKEPNPNHYAVAAMLAAGVRVWTPNFDTMIETASRRLGLKTTVVVPGDSLDADGPVLYKPHGTFPFPGDPPREPAEHDYDLLFQASRVWLLEEDWADKLTADIRGRDVYLFGYRGADPDLTPVLLDAFEGSRSVTWWEFPSGSNFERLREMLRETQVKLEPGDPSAALLALGRSLAPHSIPSCPDRPPLRPPSAPPFEPSNVSRARILGQMKGAAVARRFLTRAIFLDRGAKKLPLLLKLVRSAGYDIPWLRTPVLIMLSILLKAPRARSQPKLAELYATILDSRPRRPSDRRAISRLRQTPFAERPEVLTRIASIEKLHGELKTASEDAESSLSQLSHRRNPALEAMTVYILAWTYRQQGEFERRAQLVARYEDRMPHIGFNWAAWLRLDEALVELHAGRGMKARELMESPFMGYARRLIRHPMFRLDDDLTAALVRWHENGPGDVDEMLTEILSRHPVRRFGHPPFTAIDTLIVLADQARAGGDLGAMQHHLRRAQSRTSSALQIAETRLVEAAASGSRSRLANLRTEASAHGFGLIEQNVEAIVAFSEGRDQSGQVIYRPDLPLAAGY
jgi:hypothetical protein